MYRVVTRRSLVLSARLNGWEETSIRQRSSRTPSRRRTPRTAVSCASTGTATSGASGRAAASATSGGRACASGPKIACTRAAVSP